MSPYALLQEQVDKDKHYPWRVVVSCALLNRTTGQQAHKAAGELFRLWPDPESWRVDHERLLMLSSAEWLAHILKPLGLVNRRTELLHNLTVDYLAGISPYDCRGVGEYGRDALDVFCCNRRHFDHCLSDSYLQKYVQWRFMHENRRIEWDEVGHVEWLASLAPPEHDYPRGGPGHWFNPTDLFAGALQ